MAQRPTAGRMDQRITVERKTRTDNLTGGFVESWATAYTVWAQVKSKAGREGLDAGRTNATFVTTFTVYTISDLTEEDRIDWGGVKYNIRAILRQGGRVLTTVIEAERGVAQ